MHASKRKQACPICQREISVPNFNKHFLSCTEIAEKKTSWVCEICGKTFLTAQGYSGHKSRSHDLARQRMLGAQGNIKKRQMEADGHTFRKCVHTEETKERLSVLACNRVAKHSKYTRNVEYKPGVILESSYEVRVAEILDKLNIEWVRFRQGYEWDDNGKKRRYIPDFYLPQQNVFLDPKNDFLIKKDKRKIDSAMRVNDITVLVLSDDMINEEFLELLLVL